MRRLVLLIAIGSFFIGCGGGGDKGPKTYSQSDAWIYSQSFIKDRLKAPSTASFGKLGESTILRMDDTTFSVKSFVDSQNGFGAMIRSKYTCIITFHSNSTVSAEDILIY
jgi:hypothetical protein